MVNELGQRLAAFVIDVVICGSIIVVMLAGVHLLNSNVVSEVWFHEFFSSGKIKFNVNSLGTFIACYVAPIIIYFCYFVLPTALWGKTIGKLFLKIKVYRSLGKPPGIWRALVRELLKFVAVIFYPVGLIACGFYYFYHGNMPYDLVCETNVDYSLGLTKTQKNWRKFYNR